MKHGFLCCFSGNKKTPPTDTTTSLTSNHQSNWTFPRSSQPSISQPNKPDSSYEHNLDPDKHAIAVAAATAAAAEAALAAAQAAAEVVRLTTGGGRCASSAAEVGRGSRRWMEEMAAVKLQSAFRGYLARRALRALKALVKLQALVRGHFVRKQAADMLRRMQILAQVQNRASANRSSHHTSSCNSISNSRLTLQRCSSSSDFRNVVDLSKCKMGSDWLDRWMEESVWNDNSVPPRGKLHSNDEKDDKILEVDTWMPQKLSQQSDSSYHARQDPLDSINYRKYGTTTCNTSPRVASQGHHLMRNLSSREGLYLSPKRMPQVKDNLVFMNAENSPWELSASPVPGISGRKGPFSPARSEGSWEFFSRYASYPNYMVNTESWRAKLRSQSVPRQRLEFDKFGSSKRSLQRSLCADTERGFDHYPNLKCTNSTPPHGRLNRQGSSILKG